MTVYFTPWDTQKNLMKEAELLYDEAGTFNCIAKGDLVAIKLHVGELGNPHYVNHSLSTKLSEKSRRQAANRS